jgi:hypothetical protein
MSVWVNNERGPDCFCGDPTVVKTEGLKKPALLCIFHSRDAGAMFTLPDTRPEWWPEPLMSADDFPKPPSAAAMNEYMETAVLPEEDDEDA